LDEPGLAPALIALHETVTLPTLQSQIRDILLSRKTTAQAWLSAVDRGEIAATVTSVEQIRRVAVFADAELDALVTKHWGKLTSATPEEKLAEIRRLNNDLRAAHGNAEAGAVLFKKHCAACHQLFGQGTKLGPDLTSANRQDRDFLLVSLVDPSSVIRKEYVSVIIQTTDGRVLTGLPVSRDDAEIKLRDSKNESLSVSTGEIESLVDSPVSLMPADLYRQLSPQELRDLFAYLQRKE
jgi:putative heme-binding domain-containing protein